MSHSIDWTTMAENRTLTYSFTATADTNGFVVVPTTVVRPSTGVILGVRGNNTTDSCFALVYTDTKQSDRFTIRLLGWDLSNSYGGGSKSLTIVYVLF